MGLNIAWLVLSSVLALGGCGLDSPGGRIGWLVLLPLAIVALLLRHVLRWPHHSFYDKDERRNPDHEDE